jgi:molybdopterin/thiamine biosynthesis adenylyltransferase
MTSEADDSQAAGLRAGRYSRQVLFQGVGIEGQRRLADSSVVIVGCGALGTAQAEMLGRAGIGRLRLIDRDFVEFTNLQRQTMFTESDAAARLPKAVACKSHLSAVNSEIEIEALVSDLNPANAEETLTGVDIIFDATDNFATRYLINDVAVKHSIPWIYGAAVGSYGVTMTILPGETPCLRCVFEEPPPPGSAPTCDTAGVLMPIISVVAAAQVAEGFKLMTGHNDRLSRSLMQFDVWNNEWRGIKLDRPSAGCATCGQRKFELLEAEVQEFAASLCGRNAVQVSPGPGVSIDFDEIASRLTASFELKRNDYLLRFRAGENEFTLFRDARAIITGTNDITAARALYSRYIGI